MLTLNLGCGLNKLEGAVNIDVDPSVEPDVVHDIRQLPYEDGSVDRVYLFHTIEHIQEADHDSLLEEIHRVLRPQVGYTLISYPEFLKCVENYKENHLGMRDFWKAAIYGRQLTKSDFHVALMDTQFFKTRLQENGFVNISYETEKEQSFNTVVKAFKGTKTLSYEEAVNRSIFNAR